MEFKGKIGLRRSMLYMVLSIGLIMTLLLAVEYLIMVNAKREQAYRTSTVLIDQVRNVLLSNERKEQSLVDSLKEDYSAKAKAVSYIIDKVPETEYDIDELNRIASLMSIDEIHIFNDRGIIYSGTVPAYYNYTFDSGEQMAFFKPMLENKSLSMCQDVTPNTAEGKSMMYAICWNDAGVRMIQIGIEPHRLIEEMRRNEISDVISNMPSYEGIDILVADRDSGKILGSTISGQVGSSLSRIGISVKELDLSEIQDFRAFVLKKPAYCSVGEFKNYVIAVVQERAEVNRDLPVEMLMVFLYLLFAAVVISMIVQRMTNKILAERSNANTDPMTGLLNRRAYEEALKKHAKNAREDGLVYLSIDLNGLKTTNDNFGHDAGDALIRGAADCMRHSFGSCGQLFRIGGDEFAALLTPGENRLDALRKDFEQSQEAWTKKHGRELSTACGCASRSEFPDMSITELAKLADKRMYEEKSAYYRAKGIDRRKNR